MVIQCPSRCCALSPTIKHVRAPCLHHMHAHLGRVSLSNIYPLLGSDFLVEIIIGMYLTTNSLSGIINDSKFSAE